MPKTRRKKKSPRPKLRTFKLGDALGDLHAWRDELDEYTDILLGRKMPPIDVGMMTLMEVANAYYSRAAEMNMQILRGEAQNIIPKKSPLYYFRTGELRQFREMALAAAELGSRRLTAYRIEMEMNE